MSTPPDDPPTGSLPGQLHKFSSGPWLQTQLVISLLTGVSSFLAFCILRRRYRILYAPRTLLQGFSPHRVHMNESFFGWILPTLRTSEYAMLQLVGLDAAVLLSFLKLGFQFFSICSVLACIVLMPINYKENGSTDGASSPDDTEASFYMLPVFPMGDDGSKQPRRTLHGTDLFLTSHAITTYVFSLLALIMLHRTYTSFVQARQLFSLEHAHSIPARTVLITRLPPHLRSERQLVEYFSSMGQDLQVESVNIVRQVDTLASLLADRTAKLLKLESVWTAYVGNPAPPMPGYDPKREVQKIRDGTDAALSDAGDDVNDADASDEEQEDAPPFGAGAGVDEEAALLPPTITTFQVPGKPRPTIRTHFLFGKKMDALDYYAEAFRKADEAVRRKRSAKCRPAESAFVTFETLVGAQIASQVCHYPQPSAMYTTLAPEPRDVYWPNLTLSPTSVACRRFLVLVAMVLLLLFWSTPAYFLARLLSYDTIKSYSPKLAKLIEQVPSIQALVQNSLPSLALIGFNAILPFFLEALCYFQGFQARSWIEYSLMKKYYLYLIVTVFFIFVSASTVALLQDLTGQPTKFLEKLATTLPAARRFYVSYIMLQGIGLMPVQLLGLAVIIPNVIYRMFYVRTPREHAELNAPPVLNLGVIYPQAILIFVIGLTFSVIMPLILIFTAIYFGMAYLVFKYKLLNVYYRAFESRGQAWPITFSRIAVGLIIFQLFMTGIFTTQQAFALVACMVPLLIGTVYSCYQMHHTFGRLAHYVSLSQAAEATRELQTQEVEHFKRTNPVTVGQTNLNRARYKPHDDSVFVVAESPKTDYSQPPMLESFYGVLNTGRRRYAVPAISGQLPSPWLPSVKTVKPQHATSSEGVIINLRRQFSSLQNSAKSLLGSHGHDADPNARRRQRSPSWDDATRAWRDETLHIGHDHDHGTKSPDDEDYDSEDETAAYGTYYARPDRRPSTSGYRAGDGSDDDDASTPR